MEGGREGGRREEVREGAERERGCKEKMEGGRGERGRKRRKEGGKEEGRVGVRK